eukprot:GFUD01025432.1.p1 GENE.GFUD01025432.1~~GFUD01025432.1.p1  ORF type:complete len:674 (-),score=115.45 GFUD01025432.1:94-2115(-)
MNYTKISVDKLWKKRIAEDFLTFQEKDFLTDVTLACEDGIIRAHRLVLASFSSFLANLLLGYEADSYIFFPELSVSDVSCFVRAVYSGNLPSNTLDLQAVFIVNRIVSQMSGLKKERPESAMTVLDPSEALEDLRAKSSFMDTPEVFVNDNTDASVSDPCELKAKPRPSALTMTKEERLIKSAENLEKLCKFCLDPVINHRVSLKVKQEKNNSYHLKNQYVCCACGFVLNAPSNFVAHNNTEYSRCEASGQYPSLWQFNCNLCSKTICEHQSPSQADQCFVCCHCQEEFGSPGVLTIHLKTIKTLNLVECDVCHIAVPNTQLKKHRVTKHAEIMDKLNNSKAFNEKLSEMQDTEGLDPCSECPKFAKAAKKDKMSHFREHHPHYYSILLKHNNQVWKSAPSSQYTFCDICNKSIRKCNLKDHKFHSHGLDLDNQAVDRPQFTCDICGHVSKYAKDVKKHKRFVHERILNFSCKFCGKKFSNKGNLNQHEVIHTGVTPFQCHVCGRQCRRKSELEKHIQTHANLHPDMMKMDPHNHANLHSQMIKMDPLSTDSEHNTVTAIVSNQRVSNLLNSIPQTQLAPIPVGVPGSSPQSIPRSDGGLHPSMSRTDSGVHMIRETQHTVLTGGQQMPLIMTHIDPGSMRQVPHADLLKDITAGHHSNSTPQTIKMPTFILH